LEQAFRDRYGPISLVTGASSGIGWAFAEELAERGLDLVLTARRGDRLQELATRLRSAHGVNVQVIEVDLADAAGPALLLDRTQDLDIGLVVSNAGFGLKGPHEGNAPTAMTDMLMVKCNAPFMLAHAFIPRLRGRGKGGLLFTSSIEGLMGCPYSAAYSASKALVVSLGEALWGELAGSGVDVLTLCPGATESEAAAKQGIDIAQLQHVMPARDVAGMALDNLAEGPTFISSEFYKASFDKLLSLPRRDALRAMAAGMKG
jgi:short-subunit dehydrogenase